jgi:Icc-related predicted phosphoesterase
MKLLIFSDIHNDRRALEKLMNMDADAYVAAGDLVSWGKGLDEMGELMRRHAGKTYVLPGNHESAAATAALCERFGFHDLHGRSEMMNGYQVAGLGYSAPTPFHTPGEYSEQELAAHLAPFAGLKPLVLICHCPPKGTALDRVREGLHAGSQSVREFIEQQQPEYFFCGHIHETEGVTVELGRTRAMYVGKRGFLLTL